MKTEFKDISHGKDDEGKTFDHHCVLEVKITDDDDNVTETKEQGYMIQGKDVIYLNAPKIYPSKDTPLLTEAPDIVGAINELFMSEPEGGDWQPPPWWIPVPEPEPYDIYILIQVENAGKKFTLRLDDQQGDAGMGTVHYDWGDGTEEIYTYGPVPSHEYTNRGQYLIHVTGDENAFFLRYWNFNDQSNGNRDIVGLIIKTGAEIAFRTDYWDANNYTYTNLFGSKSFKHIKIKHSKGIPTEKVATGYFVACHDLQKIELAKKISGKLQNRFFSECYALKNLKRFIDCDNITEIGEFAFGYCCRLDNVDFPNCTEVGKNAFYQCHNLIHAEMPNCTHIDNESFGLCYNLQEITAAENCTFGTNCFQNCYSLYPRPDGSVN